jgi:hypothetical protein
MGCCESSPNDVDHSSSSVTSNERMAFEKLLATMPANCRQQLRDLPVRRVLDVYEFHLTAMFFAIRKEYFLAIFNEMIAIQELKQMLPRHEDHFMFTNMYKVLCECYYAIGHLEQAAEAGEIGVTIVLKHTPTDYKNISLQYYRLVQLYIILNKWQQTEQCIMKAIETGRQSSELPQAFIQGLEQCLVMVR